MNKTLIIIRHAKSAWPEDVPDFQRPLNKRGYDDAQLMARYLADLTSRVEAVFCSAAERAQLTLKELNKTLKLSEKCLHINEDLYLASCKQLTRFVEALPDEINTVILIGHNPGLTELCNYFTDDCLDNLPTCGIYEVAFNVDAWRACGQSMGVRKSYCVPRMLKN